MRRCIEVLVEGFRCRGTVHLPVAAREIERLGVVILHPGFLPRSGLGDGFVALAEGLAAHGILTVRIDLPGLGDSEGYLPEGALEFFHMVQEGELARFARQAVDQVRSQLGLERVVLGGLCGGAITAFFALASSEQPWIDGLFAVETLFNLVLPAETPANGGGQSNVFETLRDVKHVLYEQTRKITLKTPIGSPLQKVYRSLRRSPASATHAPVSGSLPPEANLKLLECVDQALKGKLPMLFVTADQQKKEGELEFDYLDNLLAEYPGRADRIRVLGTDHAFLAGDGTPRLIEHVTQWISGEFRGSAYEPLAQNAV